MDVWIRPPVADDAHAFVAAVQRSRLLHYPWVAPPDVPDAYAAWLGRVDGDRTLSWLVGCDDGVVGVVNANEIVRGAFWSTYLGYYAFMPLAGAGRFTAGMRLVLAALFEDVGLHRVEANIQPGNTRSLDLVRRLGFRKEGFSPRYLRIDGAWRDHERWALLVEEWRED
jgi:[ribosomal protein S5]-alanine N-acetyltransferase